MQQKNLRQSRTRTLIQVGGLVQKSGLLELFQIYLGDDLQDFENRPKAERLLGFLSFASEQQGLSNKALTQMEQEGKRLLKK